MPGWRAVPPKERREFRRRNHIARDLHTSKYRARIKESKRRHLIDELHEQDAEEELYEFEKEIGLAPKE